MPRTNVPGDQIRDASVQRVDLDVDTSGEAVIAKILTDTTLQIVSSTGADAGTGDVTLGLDSGGFARIEALSTTKVPGGGFLMLGHGGIIPYTLIPITFANAVTITDVTIGVGTADSSRSYTVDLYDDPNTSPALNQSLLTLAVSQTGASATGLSINIAAGDYGLALQRASGSGASTFSNIVVSIFVKAQ